MSSFRFRLFYSMYHGTQYPDADANEPLLLVPYFRKKSWLEVRKEGRKEGIHTYTCVCVFCAYGRAFPEAVLRMLEFLIRKFRRAVFGRFLSVWMKTVTTRRVGSKPSNASAQSIEKTDTVIGYWIIPNVRYNTEKKARDNAVLRLDANFFKPSGRYVSPVSNGPGDVRVEFWMKYERR